MAPTDAPSNGVPTQVIATCPVIDRTTVVVVGLARDEDIAMATAAVGWERGVLVMAAEEATPSKLGLRGERLRDPTDAMAPMDAVAAVEVAVFAAVS